MSDRDCALVLASDEGFARGLAVAVHSTLTNLSPALRPEIYLLDNGLSDDSRARLTAIASRLGRAADLRWITIPAERLDDVPKPLRLPAASYARLLISEVVAPTIRRVVYLDSDVLALVDLATLFELDLGGAVIAAARDLAVTTVEHDRLHLPATDRPQPYYNAGVLVIDIPGWRRAGLASQALEFASRRTLHFGDQDALNAVVERWCTLDPRWNVQTGNLGLARRRLITDRGGYRRNRELYRTAAVLHFLGPGPKPWDPHCELIGARRWATAFVRSGWLSGTGGAFWLSRWFVARAVAWPGISVARWRSRFASVNRALRRRARGPA